MLYFYEMYFECDEGYIFNGLSIWKCILEGVWSGILVLCEGMKFRVINL